MTVSLDQIVTLIATAALGAVAFLIKHFFAGIRADVGRVEKDVASLAGRVESLQSDIRANTTEMARASSELRAIWRFIDAPKRATDGGPDA